MQLFKRFFAAPIILVFVYAPIAQAAWYQIEVIAFEHRSGEDAEAFTSDVGEPLWGKGSYLLDEDEAEDRKQELIAKAHAEERADAAAAAAPAPEAQPKPAAQATADAKPPEGFVSVESLLEQDAPKPAAKPVVAAAATESKPVTNKKIYEVPFVDLPSNAFTMNKVESYLEDNRDYRILTHVAWRQPALSNNTEMVRIYGGDVVASGSNLRYDQPGKIFEFEALVTLSQSKYFHLDVDAVLRESGFQYDASDYVTANDLGLVTNDEGERYRNPKMTTYRISQSQKVKGGQLYYFDHPLMGMIVKITPYGA